MSVLLVTSAGPRAGRTHVAAALGRSLHRSGWRVAPLHLGPAAGERYACPEGGEVSRAAAVLAEACGLRPETRFEPGPESWETAIGEFPEFECVIVEGQGPPDAGPRLLVRRDGEQVRVMLDERPLAALPLLPGVDLMPEEDGSLGALPPYAPGSPRVGVVSLPHLEGFSRYTPVRGAEWITMPLPGRFAVILLPATSNPESDREWLSLAGLDEWLVMQKMSGCRVLALDEGLGPVGQVVGREAAAGHAALSRLLGARLPAPLPEEHVYERLADWWEAAVPPATLEPVILQGRA